MRVVELFQTAFMDGDLEEEATWHAGVLIPKGNKDYRGISLVEVMWKVVAEILNRRFTVSITYHNTLHGFRAGLGTGTATLEAKLLQQLAALREEVLYVIFLDLSKASYALYRSRKITYRTSSLKAASCWSSLASRVAVPVPRPDLKPWRAS